MRISTRLVTALTFALAAQSLAAAQSPSSKLKHAAAGGSATSSRTKSLPGVSQPAAVSVAPPLIISEFRLRGPNGATDEFVEIYNNSGFSHTVAAAVTDGSGDGYAVAASDGVVRCVIPNGTTIPAGGHYLCTNSAGYSLASYPAGDGTTATGDATYTADIPDNAGIALFNNSVGGVNFSIANRFDAVGSTAEGNALYKEGAGYPALIAFSIEYSWVRDLVSGTPKDTDDNAADFLFVDTNATCAFAGDPACSTGATALGQRTGTHLGAPGPENLSSPVQRNAGVKATLIDPGCTGTGPGPNANPVGGTCPRVRDLTVVPNGANGTLSIRRRWVNSTGAGVTRLRFRVVDITTYPEGPLGVNTGNVDLRALTSSDVTGTCVGAGSGCASAGAVVTIQGTTLETPPAQANGGGFNSTLSAGTITLLQPLANGAAINLQFLFGVNGSGHFRVFVNVEALP